MSSAAMAACCYERSREFCLDRSVWPLRWTGRRMVLSILDSLD
jgi:hypothetical protein